jgi:hypothetical protein
MVARTATLLGLGFALLASGAGGPAVAQAPADSVRQAALRDFHGDDLRGKDGPLASAGMDLLLLYHEFRHRKARGADTDRFTSERTRLEVRNGRVVVDATAAGPAEQLRRDLEALGAAGAEAAGGLVSGRLPVGRIPEAARLKSLRGMAPARAQTQAGRARSRAAEAGVRRQPAQDTAATPDPEASDLEAPEPSAPGESTSGESTSGEEGPGEEGPGEEGPGEEGPDRKPGGEGRSDAAPGGAEPGRAEEGAGSRPDGGAGTAGPLVALALMLGLLLLVET